MASPISRSSQGRLFGRVVLITGAGGAIGREIAIACAEEGAKVSICDADETKLLATAAEIKETGFSEVLLKTVDVSSETEVEQWVKETVKKWNGIHVLVNNAAAFVFGTVETATLENWDKVLNVNVKGYALCMKYAAAEMKKQKSGSIINMASISSLIAQSGFVPYNTSKAAILGLTRCTALDLGSYGIRANTICPGVIDTPATDSHAKSLGISKEELVADYVKLQCLKRIGTTRDVANAVLFLATDQSSFMTGTNLVLDGGYTAI